jgi:hypothetical protein
LKHHMHVDFRQVDIHKIGLFAKSMKQSFINCNYPNSVSHTHTHTLTYIHLITPIQVSRFKSSS